MKNFYINNRKKLFDLMEENSIAIFHSGITFKCSADEYYDFAVDKNFYYLTGINQENVVLLMVKNGNERKAILFIEANNPRLVKWVGAKLEKEEAIEISGVDEVVHFNGADLAVSLTEEVLQKYLDEYVQSGIKNIYWNEELYDYCFDFHAAFIKSMTKEYVDINLLNGYDLVVGLRMIKEDYEVEQIKASIEVTKTGIEELMRHCTVGLLEYELESYFDYHIKNHGQRVTSFKTIAAGGYNATTLHYSSNNCVLKDNELVLFDLGCKTNLYASDITRTFPINGKFTDRQKEVYEEVLNVNKKCIAYIKPGITRREFNQYALKLLTEACYRLGLIENDEDVRKYYMHSIGHSLGLDTHDPALYDKPFAKGVVYTVEPGLYIEEENIGIRIEDDVLVTDNGCINLSSDIIKEVADIEEFMQKFNK